MITLEDIDRISRIRRVHNLVPAAEKVDLTVEQLFLLLRVIGVQAAALSHIGSNRAEWCDCCTASVSGPQDWWEQHEPGCPLLSAYYLARRLKK